MTIINKSRIITVKYYGTNILVPSRAILYKLKDGYFYTGFERLDTQTSYITNYKCHKDNEQEAMDRYNILCKNLIKNKVKETK
jgi:hypothetical protein